MILAATPGLTKDTQFSNFTNYFCRHCTADKNVGKESALLEVLVPLKTLFHHSLIIFHNLKFLFMVT